jgi:hypothetical protein
MTKFSNRIGITQTETKFQIDGMNEALKNSLWNVIVDDLHNHILRWHRVMEILYFDFFKEPIDNLPNDDQCRFLLRIRFQELEWFDVYNLVEFIIQNIGRLTDNRQGPSTLEHKVNGILERELSAYRSINLQLVPISNESEIQAIQQASTASSAIGIAGVSEHINTALKLLGKKPEPDYRNSIKESISALEGLCKVIVGEKSGGLEKALNKMTGLVDIHPALRTGLLNLYGYSSNEDGIRHPILESSNVGFAEAKFMLVACSAAVNFVIDKAREASLL